MQRMQRYLECLEKLNVLFDLELAIYMVLNSLTPSSDQFILTYHFNNTETTLTELHNLLQTTKSGMKKNHVLFCYKCSYHGNQIWKREKRKAPSQFNYKGKAHVGGYGSGSKSKPKFEVTSVSNPMEATCFHYGEKGH